MEPLSLLTSLTRAWLTRSPKPFVFTNQNDQLLPYAESQNLGLYVHIPFCKSICGFCPYCKTLYSPKACDEYIDALIREIEMVGGQIKGKKEVTSLYFGGGSPALALGRPAVDAAALAETLKAVPFETVSMDLIFALPGQTFEDLKADVDTAFLSGANYIAIYPLIVFTFTRADLPPMPNRQKRRLLDAVTAYCLGLGCTRTSIWTFSREAGRPTPP